MLVRPKSDFATYLFPKLTSTMDAAKKIASTLSPFQEILFVTTREQTAGRGRGGSEWTQPGVERSTGQFTLDEAQFYSDFAEALRTEQDCLPFTLVVPGNRLKIPASWVSIATGCALFDAVKEVAGFARSTFADVPFPTHDIDSNIKLKWPNDLVFEENGLLKKIAGTLCESQFQGTECDFFYIGIGFNFFEAPENVPNAASFLDWLAPQGTLNKNAQKKLTKILNDRALKNVLLTRFASVLQRELQEYLCVERTAEQLRMLFLERTFPKGTLLSVKKGAMSGLFKGLTLDGAFLLDGHPHPITSADISLPLKTLNSSQTKTKKKQSELKTVQIEDSASKPRPAQEELEVGLALDLGNSRVHWAFGDTKGALFFGHLNYTEVENEATLLQNMRPLLTFLKENRVLKLYIPCTAVCSRSQKELVYSHLDRFFQRMLPELKRYKTELTAKDLASLAKLNYNPTELGADRALRFLFAKKKAQESGNPVAVFSFGTATTVEAVSKEGDIIESQILPGLQMGLDALSEKTALLPKLEYRPETETPAQWNTNSSLLRGATFFAESLVAEIVRRLHIPKVYLSGGNAKRVSEALQEKGKDAPDVVVEENLETETLLAIGLRFLLAQNATVHHGSAKLSTSKSFVPQQMTASPKPTLRAMDENKRSSESDEEGSTPQANVAPWLLKTMLKARFQRSLQNIKQPTREDFRRIGGRLENVDIGVRLDRYLAKHYPFLSRDLWRARIFSNEVMIQHNSPKIPEEPFPKISNVKHTYRVQSYDQIWIFHPPELEPDSVNECDVLYDDGDVVAFSKPGNLVVHATGMYMRNTFINLAQRMGYGDSAPVHRIDRETSGLLLCARKSSTRNNLALAFRHSEMRKMYFAITRGTRPLPSLFRANLPIGDASDSRIRLKMWVNTVDALPSITDFAHLSSVDDFHLLACFPRTGRTNQIRIHLCALGHWIVGDKMYHPNEDVFIDFFENGLTDWVSKQLLFPRHLLHNAAIEIPESASPTAGAIVAPLTSDIFEFQYTKSLLEAAGMSGNQQQMSEAFLNLFLRYKDHDFSEEEHLE